MREPLVPPAVSLIAGMLLAPYLAPALGWAAIGAGLLAGCALARRHWTWIWAPLAVAGFGWGVLLASAAPAAKAPRMLARPGEIVWLEGCLVERPRPLPTGGHRLLLELEPGARVRVSQSSAPSAPLKPGDRIGLTARVREPRNFENPGSFDYRGWLARRQIYWLASATGSTEVRGSCPANAALHLARIRTSLLDRLERLYSRSRYDSGMMAALLLGDDGALEDAWTEPYRLTGAYHLLVVSGAHVSLLAGVLLVILQRISGRTLALALACAAAWAYAFLAGAEPPVLRAAAGFSFFLFTAWLHRRTRLLNVLAVTTIAFLAHDQPQVNEPSFILSFGAVAALGALAIPLAERLFRPWESAAYQLESTQWDANRAPEVAARRVELRLVAECLALLLRLRGKWACRMVAWGVRGLLAFLNIALATVAIQTALAVPMLGWFHRLSFTGVPANLLTTFPLTISIPVGFLALLTGWGWLAAAAAFPLHLSASVVSWLSRWEPDLRFPDPSPAFVLAFVAALAILCVAVRSSGALRRWALAGGLCAALAGCCLPFAQARAPGGWFEIDMLDVGDGDALFLRFPNGATAVLDTGGLPSINGVKPRIDIGEDVVSPYLWNLGLWRLDLAILSHAHADHAGGFPALAANFRPAALWTGVSEPRALPSRVEHRRWTTGDTLDWGGVRIQALAPGRDTPPADGNAASLVLLLQHGDHRFLFPGDLDRRGDRTLVEAGALGPVDVLKVAHHGGASSSTEEFLAAVRPRHALISTAGSLPGRPHARVLNSLGAKGARVWRTDRDGMISVRSDGHRLEVRAHGRRAGRSLVWPAP